MKGRAVTQTVLILGATGRFGQSACRSFSWAGWDVRCFDRSTQDLADAAWGADLIVNAWNPAYTDWAQDVPRLTQQVIDTAKSTGAKVLIPGNLYVYGQDMPDRLHETTPHRATNPLGRIRIEMEEAYKDAGIDTIILRAGDYIDTRASGNWFDKILTAKLKNGVFTYPGNPDIPHAWAFLPDVTDIAVCLARDLDAYTGMGVTDISVPGLTLTGRELGAAIADVTGRDIALREMSWLPIQVARPIWSMAAPLLEMRYLWNTPHRVASDRLSKILPGFAPTPLEEVLAASLPDDVYPDGFVRSSRVPRLGKVAGYLCCGDTQPG